jgi:hypothetical protein
VDPSRPLLFSLSVVLAPAVVAGLALLAGLRGRIRTDARTGAVAAIGVALAYALGHCASLGEWPAVPPRQATHALAWSAIAAGLAAALAFARSVPRWTAAALLAAAGGGAAWLTLRNVLARWSAGASASLLVACALAIGLGGLALERWGDRRRGASLPLALWIAATALALAQLISGSAVFAQFGGSLAAVAGAMVVLAWLAPSASLSGGAVAVFTAVLALHGVAGVLLSDLPVASALLAFASPSAALAVDRGAVGSLAGWRGVAARAAACAVPAAAALAVAWVSRPPPSPY